jgi:hypothetical protein
LNENASVLTVFTGTTLNVGSPGEDGTILWRTNSGSVIGADATVDVQAGTLKAGDANFSLLLGFASLDEIAAGAAIDLAGFDTIINNLTRNGTITNSGAAATLTLTARRREGRLIPATSAARCRSSLTTSKFCSASRIIRET